MSDEAKVTFDLLNRKTIGLIAVGVAGSLIVLSILPDPNGLPKDPAQWPSKFTEPGAALKYNPDLNPSLPEPIKSPTVSPTASPTPTHTESPTVSPTASPTPAYLDPKIRQSLEQPTRMPSRTPTRIPPTVPQNPASQRKQ